MAQKSPSRRVGGTRWEGDQMSAGGPVRVGLMLPTMNMDPARLAPDRLARIAASAEAGGMDALWVGDHIVHPWNFHECLTTLAFIAAHTSRIDLGSCVLQLPMRQLSVAAKQIASIALLSEGRLRLGVGVGGEIALEWRAAGIARRERGARLDEAVPLLRQLFAGDTVTADGRFFALEGFELRPVPPPIPLYFGGRSAGLQRAAKVGDGWLGAWLSLAGFARCRAELDAALDGHGRSPQGFDTGMMLPVYVDDRDDGAHARAAELMCRHLPAGEVGASIDRFQRFLVAGTPARVAEQLKDWAAAGCDTFVLSVSVEHDARQDEQIDALVNDVLPLLA